MRRDASPVRLVLITALTIFVLEGLIMLMFSMGASFFGRLSPQAEGLLDAALLTALVSPVLYGVFLRPMRAEIVKRMQAGAVCGVKAGSAQCVPRIPRVERREAAGSRQDGMRL